MNDAALIVAETLGSPLEAGIPAAIRTLAYLFKLMGLVVHLMVLRKNSKEEKEAEELDVRLILPSPEKSRFKGLEAKQDWLYMHAICFPGLNKLRNICFVCGFGLVSSDAAHDIKETLFNKAHFILINTLSLESDFDTHRKILGYPEPNMELRQEEFLYTDSTHADLVCSIWKNVYTDFKRIYATIEEMKHKHFPLYMIPTHQYMEKRPLDELGEDEELIVITPIQPEHLKHDDNGYIKMLSPAMSSVAKGMAEMKKPPPKWKVFDVSFNDKNNYDFSKFNVNGYLRLSRHSIMESVYDEVCCSHLALIPPKSMVSSQFTLAAMAIGIPIIVPRGSESCDIINKYSEYYRSDVSVDMMNKTENLEKRIIHVNRSYRACLEEAQNMKTVLKRKIPKVNDEFETALNKMRKKAR
ncbi:uncharacterized protein LOC144356733 [Saccoglossus kowalevskii]